MVEGVVKARDEVIGPEEDEISWILSRLVFAPFGMGHGGPLPLVRTRIEGSPLTMGGSSPRLDSSLRKVSFLSSIGTVNLNYHLE